MDHRIPHKTTLDIAKERLKAFMDKHNATLDECAKIMGIRDKKELKALLKAKTIHSYSDMVVQEFGSAGLSVAVGKLTNLREGDTDVRKPDTVKPEAASDVMSETTSESDISEDVMSETIQDQAMKAVEDFKKEHQLSDSAASLALGFSVSNLCNVRKAYAEGKMGQRAANNVLKRIAEYKPAKAPVVESEEPSSNYELAKLAKRMFTLYRTGQACKVTCQGAVAMMNKKKPAMISRVFKPQTLSVAFSPSSIKKMPQELAEDILFALGACYWTYFPDELLPYKAKDTVAGDPVSEPKEREPIEAAKEASDVDVKNMNQDSSTITSNEQKIEDILVRLHSNAQFREAFNKQVKEASLQRIEDLLGVSLDELKAIAPQVDILVAAKRHQSPVQLVVG